MANQKKGETCVGQFNILHYKDKLKQMEKLKEMETCTRNPKNSVKSKSRLINKSMPSTLVWRAC